MTFQLVIRDNFCLRRIIFIQRFADLKDYMISLVIKKLFFDVCS